MQEVRELPLEEKVPIIRAFSHYLQLTSIAETHHRYIYRHPTHVANSASLFLLQLHAYASTLACVEACISSSAYLSMRPPYNTCMPLLAAAIGCTDARGCGTGLHRVRNGRTKKQSKSCDEVFGYLLATGVEPEDLYNAVVNQQVRQCHPHLHMSYVRASDSTRALVRDILHGYTFECQTTLLRALPCASCRRCEGRASDIWLDSCAITHWTT